MVAEYDAAAPQPRHRADRRDAPPLLHAAAPPPPVAPAAPPLLAAAGRYATSCRPAACRFAGRLLAALSRQGDHGPRLTVTGSGGAVLLARRWMGSWDGGPV